MDVKIIRLKVKILVEKDEDSYHAYCPELKGLHVGGESEKDALNNAVEAVQMYLESLVKHNEPIPVGLLDGEPWSFRGWLRDKFGHWSRESYVREVQLPVAA